MKKVQVFTWHNTNTYFCVLKCTLFKMACPRQCIYSNLTQLNYQHKWSDAIFVCKFPWKTMDTSLQEQVKNMALFVHATGWFLAFTLVFYRDGWTWLLKIETNGLGWTGQSCHTCKNVVFWKKFLLHGPL